MGKFLECPSVLEIAEGPEAIERTFRRKAGCEHTNGFIARGDRCDRVPAFRADTDFQILQSFTAGKAKGWKKKIAERPE
jgi:hypothetical protein